MNDKIEPVEEAAPVVASIEELATKTAVIKPKMTERLREYANVFLHSLWMTMTLVGLLFFSFLFVPLKYQSAVTIWINPFILLLSLGKLYVDIAKHTGKPASTALTILASWILVLCSGFKTIADFRSKLFDPIRNVTGTLYVTFDKLLPAGQVVADTGSDGAALIKAPLTNNNEYYFLTITRIMVSTTGRKVGTAITAEQVTQVLFSLSGESALIRNHLDEISSDSLSKNFDYLKIDSIDFPTGEGCTFEGVLHIIINGKHEYHFSIPRQTVAKNPSRPIAHTPVIAPLNEKALELMYQYADSYHIDPNFKLRWGTAK